MHRDRRTWIRWTLAAAVTTTAAALGGPATAPRVVVAQGPETPGTTTREQVDLSVTVYNSNIALVRDVRDLELPGNAFSLRFMDIAASINPATVHFRSLTEPSKLRVLEQNYEYDLLEPDKLLQKYVGREVTLVRLRTEGGATRTDEVRATLLSNNNGPIWRIGNEIVTGLHADHLRFPELPDNLYSTPTLVWMLENGGSRKQRVEASYLAGEMAWNADYVLTVGRDARAGDLDGWVTVSNNSGAAYRNAKLQLVAGELHRVREDLDRMSKDESRSQLEVAAVAMPFSQEAFSEYHLYTLGSRTTLNNRQTKQISLLTGTGIPVTKLYAVEGQDFYYHNVFRPGTPQKDAVRVFYQFKNDVAAGLGAPMPAGTVRVYQADSKGGTQFVGEDRITHTPKDEMLTLEIGNAFDVVCERKQTDFKRISDRVHEAEFEITLRNHKDTAIDVEVREPIAGDWQMLHSSHKWVKSAAWAAAFTVPVSKDGTAVLKYRVRIR